MTCLWISIVAILQSHTIPSAPDLTTLHSLILHLACFENWTCTASVGCVVNFWRQKAGSPKSHEYRDPGMPIVIGCVNFYGTWWSGSLAFTHGLIHANFTSHTTLSSPPTRNSLSLHRLHIQGGHLRSICHLFLSLASKEWWDNVMEHHQHCISESIIHCSQPTEALNQCTCIL